MKSLFTADNAGCISERSRHMIFSKVIEVACAAKRAMEQSAEADRRYAELTDLAQRAGEQAASVRDLSASLTQTASAVARVAIEVCRYHSYRQAFDATIAAQSAAHRAPPIDVETFLALVDNSTQTVGLGTDVRRAGLVTCNEVDETTLSYEHDRRCGAVGNDLGQSRHQAVCDESTNTELTIDDSRGVPISSECSSSFCHSVSVPAIRLPCSTSTVTSGPATSVTCFGSAISSPPSASAVRRDASPAYASSSADNDRQQYSRKQFRTGSGKTLQFQSARTACRSSSYIIEQMSSDSEVEDILLRTPTLQKLRTLDKLSTDSLDPELLQAAAATAVSSGQVRQSRPRDRQHRRSFSPLLDSTERDHYSVTRMDESGRNSPKHIFIPVTSESLSGTRLQSAGSSAAAEASAIQQPRDTTTAHHQHRPSNSTHDT